MQYNQPGFNEVNSYSYKDPNELETQNLVETQNLISSPINDSKSSYELRPVVDTDRVCRNCHEDIPVTDLIAPCRCTGSIKWVHRNCLDQWRAVSPNPTSFSQCDVCNYTYQLEYVPEKTGCCVNWRYHFYVTRDFLAIFILVNLLTTLFSVIFHFADPGRQRDIFFKDLGWHHPVPLVADWLYGWIALLFLIGITGIIYGTVWFCCGIGSAAPTYNTYSYNTWGCYYCFWVSPYQGGGGDCCGSGHGGDCNCSGGDCGGCSGGGGGGGDAGSVLVFILVIFIVIIVLIGLAIAICLIVAVGANILRRHLRYLQNKDLAARYIVKDLSNEVIV